MKVKFQSCKTRKMIGSGRTLSIVCKALKEICRGATAALTKFSFRLAWGESQKCGGLSELMTRDELPSQDWVFLRLNGGRKGVGASR